MHQIRTLYKAILRLHRSLPKELKELGDVYVKDEFRRHIKSSNEAQNKLFLREWADYYSTLAKQAGLTGHKPSTTFGKPLPPEKLEEFENQQLYQLYELKQAAQPDFVSDDETSRKLRD